jgi:hypothetical protein
MAAEGLVVAAAAHEAVRCAQVSVAGSRGSDYCTPRGVCPPGLHGLNCDLGVDECARQPCRHGLCQQDELAYSCVCVAGWAGANCADADAEATPAPDEATPCTSEPCQNGGACVTSHLHTDYGCTCTLGWGGTDCSDGTHAHIDYCEAAPCLNGGACVDRRGGFDCECVNGYHGGCC